MSAPASYLPPDPPAPPTVPFWRDRRVLVTGATGLLGRSLVAELAAQGAHVTCLVRTAGDHVRARFSDCGPVSLVYGRLESYDALAQIFGEGRYEAVYHLGGQSLVAPAERWARLTFEANVRGTWNLLEACREAGQVERIVMASSEGVYGEQAALPCSERMKPRPMRPYDVSKMCSELVARSYWHTYGLPVVVTRCTHLYGPGDRNFNRLIPGTIRAALRDKAPVLRSDGTPVHDYLFVRDAVAAYLRLGERCHEPEIAGDVYNLAAEAPRSVLDVVQTILRLMKKEHLRPQLCERSSPEVARRWMDCGKARAALAWTPRYTLEAGLADTIDWYGRQSLLC